MWKKWIENVSRINVIFLNIIVLTKKGLFIENRKSKWDEYLQIDEKKGIWDNYLPNSPPLNPP